MYAVIRAGGKQQRVEPGDVIQVELMAADGGTVTFQPILVVDDQGATHVGKDVAKAVVTAKPLGDEKGEKVRVLKYRPKTGYSRVQGHRQRHTLLEIQDVKLSGAPPKTSAKPKSSTAKPKASAAKPKASTATPKASTKKKEGAAGEE